MPEHEFYYSSYKFNLFSNFTFFNGPVNGDQIKQKEDKEVYGYISKFNFIRSKENVQLNTIVETGLRYDVTHGSILSHTLNKTTLVYAIQLGNINEVNAFLYADKKLKPVAGYLILAYELIILYYLY